MKITTKQSLLIFLTMILLISCVEGNSGDPQGVEMKNSEFDSVFVFLDNSASMFNYEKGNDNFFRSDLNKLFDIINDVQKAEPSWYFNVVNTKIHKINIGLDHFRRGNNVYTNKLKVGNLTRTDYEKIFDLLLQNTSNSGISIFITDLLYDTKDLVHNSPEGVAASFESMAKNKFREFSKKGKSTIIIKMTANYKGNYYPNFSNNGKKLPAFKVDQERPYYVIILGKTENINLLIKSKTFGQKGYLKERMQGFDNYFSFFNPEEFKENIYYTALPYSLKPVKFSASKDDLRGNNSITNLYYRYSGIEGAFYIAADFTKVPLFNYYLNERDYYEVSPNDLVEIEEIKNVNNVSIHNLDKKRLKACNKVIEMELDKIENMQIVIKLKTVLPEWIEETDSKTDGINNHAGTSTTFAFLNFMRGLQDAYRFDSDIIKMNINIKKD